MVIAVCHLKYCWSWVLGVSYRERDAWERGVEVKGDGMWGKGEGSNQS